MKTTFYPSLHTKLFISTYRFDHLVQRQYLFLSFFIRDFLLWLLYFPFLRSYGLNAWDLPVLLIKLTLQGFVMIGSLEFHGWCTCPDHEMKKYKNYRRYNGSAIRNVSRANVIEIGISRGTFLIAEQLLFQMN